jgi:hypothetical protein
MRRYITATRTAFGLPATCDPPLNRARKHPTDADALQQH